MPEETARLEVARGVMSFKPATVSTVTSSGSIFGYSLKGGAHTVELRSNAWVLNPSNSGVRWILFTLDGDIYRNPGSEFIDEDTKNPSVRPGASIRSRSRDDIVSYFEVDNSTVFAAKYGTTAHGTFSRNRRLIGGDAELMGPDPIRRRIKIADVIGDVVTTRLWNRVINGEVTYQPIGPSSSDALDPSGNDNLHNELKIYMNASSKIQIIQMTPGQNWEYGLPIADQDKRYMIIGRYKGDPASPGTYTWGKETTAKSVASTTKTAILGAGTDETLSDDIKQLILDRRMKLRFTEAGGGVTGGGYNIRVVIFGLGGVSESWEAAGSNIAPNDGKIGRVWYWVGRRGPAIRHIGVTLNTAGRAGRRIQSIFVDEVEYAVRQDSLNYITSSPVPSLNHNFHLRVKFTDGTFLRPGVTGSSSGPGFLFAVQVDPNKAGFTYLGNRQVFTFTQQEVLRYMNRLIFTSDPVGISRDRFYHNIHPGGKGQKAIIAPGNPVIPNDRLNLNQFVGNGDTGFSYFSREDLI